MAAPRHLRRWLIIAGVGVAAVGAGLWWWQRPATVTTEPVRRGRVIEAVYATGTVEPIHRVVVKARVSDHVEAILAEEGDAVTTGQVLARIHNPLRAYALTQGKTQLTRAERQAGASSPQLAALTAQARALEAQLEFARLELGRTERLRASGAVTQQALDAARLSAVTLEAQTEAAKQGLRSARLELAAARDQLATQVDSLASEVDEREVASPITGQVLRRDVEPGEVVAVNQALFEVADLSTLLIELHVDEADIARVHDGASPSVVALSFFAFPGKSFAGTVVAILPEPDRVRRSYTVKVGLDAPVPGLRVGMTAEANLVVTRRDDALLVPAPAVTGDQAWFVERGRAVRRRLTLGIRDLTHVEVLAGAAEGDLAVTGGDLAGLRAGDRVKTTKAAVVAAPQAAARATP